MTSTLYNLRTSDLGYRVTKFTDGEVESSYLTSDQVCDCPAGHRAICRHRQMLPDMLASNICDTEWFYDYDRRIIVNINGDLCTRALEELCAPAEQDTESSVPAGQHTAAESLPPVQTVDRSLIEHKPDDSFREFLRKEGKVPRHLHPQEVHTSKNPWRRL